MTTKTVTIYDEDEEYSVEAPARWEICHRCNGDGKHSNPAIDGNGITQSEWEEWAPEDREDYMNGFYDIQCEICSGSGKVLVIDREAFKINNTEDFRKWEESERSDAEYRAIADSESRWERRMLYGSDY